MLYFLLICKYIQCLECIISIILEITYTYIYVNNLESIEENLLADGYKRGVDYEIMLVPNITNITYGRGVGYAFEEETFDEEISSISATKIREELRKKGEL